MGLLSVVEDRPTPKNVYNWRVYTCALVASLASCMIGYDSAFIGTTLALPGFKQEFGFDHMSSTEVGKINANIVSIYQAGAFFGSIFAYASTYYLGRRNSLALWSLVFVLGAGLTLGPNAQRGLGLMYAGRVITGLGVGATSMTTPIYIAEIAPPSIRGRLVGLFEFSWQIGGLVGFWINYGIEQHIPASHMQWIIPFAIQLVPAGGLLIGSFFLRESPRWLLSMHKREAAIKNLCWIRNLPATDPYIVEEVALLDQALESQRQSIGEGFLKPVNAAISNRKVVYRFLLGGLLFMFQNGSGINAVNYYSPTVFKSLGLDGGSSSFLSTGIFGVVKTISAIVWLLFLIDQLGRRKLLIGGGAGGSACMWIIGGYLAGQGNIMAKEAKLTSGGIAAVFFFYLWTACYGPTWNGTPWVLNSEMFDTNTRQLGQAWASANNWFWNFIISRFTPQMFANMGPQGCGVFMFFGGMMILSIVFVYFLIPETKSIPLEQIDRLFSIKPVRKANKIVLEEGKFREAGFASTPASPGLEEADKDAVARVETNVLTSTRSDRSNSTEKTDGSSMEKIDV